MPRVEDCQRNDDHARRPARLSWFGRFVGLRFPPKTIDCLNGHINWSACTTRNTKSCAGLGPTSLWSSAGLSSFRFVCFKEEGYVRGFWLATWHNLSKKAQRAPTNKPQPNGHKGGGYLRLFIKILHSNMLNIPRLANVSLHRETLISLQRIVGFSNPPSTIYLINRWRLLSKLRSKSFGFLQIPVLGNWHCQFVIIMDEECIQSSATASVDLIFKFEKILPGVEKSASMSPARVKNPRILENKIECQTPEKINEPLNTKYHEGQAQLPDPIFHGFCFSFLFFFLL